MSRELVIRNIRVVADALESNVPEEEAKQLLAAINDEICQWDSSPILVADGDSISAEYVMTEWARGGLVRLDYHIADNAGTPHVSITDAESGDALFQSIFSVAHCELAEEISKRFNSHTRLVEALRETSSIAHAAHNDWQYSDIQQCDHAVCINASATLQAAEESQ